MPAIHIENVGPITEAEFNLDTPGLYVLEGSPGAGKTTVLRSIGLAVDGRSDVKPTKKDGANRGLIEVAGKTIRISKTTRQEGELSVEGLGDLSIADLHTPAFKDAKTRDRHRIVTLVRLAGVEAKADLFYELLGGKADFKEIVSTRMLETDDLVEMATRVKAEIEKECRRIETLRTTALSDAKSQQSIADEVNLTQPHDEWALQRTLEQSIAEHAKVKEKREAYRKTVKAADAARERLVEFPPGKSISEATAAVELASKADREASDKVVQLGNQIRDLQVKLELAESDRRATKQSLNAANDALGAAKNAIALRGELDAAIEAAGGAKETTEDEVDDAAESVGIARQASELGMQIRQAIKAEEKAKTHLAKAKELSERIEYLRNAAADTMNVLTDSIARIEDCPLKVKMSEDGDARLIISTDRSESEYFDERSDGLRWDVVMAIAAKPNRLIPLSQAAFGELAPSLKTRLHELAVRNSCYVITAVAQDCELHCSRYVEHSEAAE